MNIDMNTFRSLSIRKFCNFNFPIQIKSEIASRFDSVSLTKSLQMVKKRHVICSDQFQVLYRQQICDSVLCKESNEELDVFSIMNIRTTRIDFISSTC